MEHEHFRPGSCSGAGDFRLTAALTVWNEADIIEACVRNLFAEGCDEVVFLDNGSADDTVALAEGAGARCLGVFHTEGFNDAERRDRLCAIAKEMSAASGAPSWWLFLDADEFPTGPGRLTVREYLAAQPEAVRCVGSYWVNHFPGFRPQNLPGFHPADLQPLAGLRRPATPFCIWGRYCPQEHAKHQLVRYDPGRPVPEVGLGFHSVSCAEPLVEPQGGILTHHFQFRAPEQTLSRLLNLTRPNDKGFSRHAPPHVWEAWRRGELATSRHQYNHRVAVAEAMYDPARQEAILGYRPEDWRALLSGPDGHAGISRWYGEGELREAVAAALPPEEHAVWLADRTGRVAAEGPEFLLAEAARLVASGDRAGAVHCCKLLARRHPRSAQARQALELMAGVAIGSPMP